MGLRSSCLAIAGLAAALLLACGPRRVGPPPPAPAVAGPEDAIARDLDVVVRIDLERMRNALGSADAKRLMGRAGETAGGGATDAALLADLLARSETVWLALRPGVDTGLTDNVMVLRGRFAGVDPRSHRSRSKWTSAGDLGGGWRVYERAEPPTRSAPARVYLRGDDLVVVVSTAEIDSVERAIDGRAGEAQLAPPRKGVVSVEARARGLAVALRGDAPAAARLLGRARRLRGYADLGAAALKAEVEIVFDSEDTARNAAQAATLIAREVAQVRSAVGMVAANLVVDTVASTVVLRLSLEEEQLAALLACAFAGHCSADAAEGAPDSSDGVPADTGAEGATRGAGESAEPGAGQSAPTVP
jgi:hypothetical protein